MTVYFLLGCPLNCNTCKSDGTCITCQNILKTGNDCSVLIACTISNFLNTSTGLCDNCASKYGDCLKCSDTQCLVCNAQSYLNRSNCNSNRNHIGCGVNCKVCINSTKCTLCNNPDNDGDLCTDISEVCNGDSYLNGNVCIQCSTTFNSGCLRCTLAACLTCDYNYFLESGNCTCIILK